MSSIVNALQSQRYRIVIVTHAPRGSRIGNRVTALRWAKFLRQAGHHVQLVAPEPFVLAQAVRVDAVIVLHARRCAALQRGCFSQAHHPWRQAAWIVALTGTDIYGDWPNAEELADAEQQLSAIIALQDDMKQRLPASLQARTQVIYQSAALAPAYPTSVNKPLRVLVSGHLRREKDPFAAVRALHHFLPNATINVRHCGGEIEAGFRQQALAWQTVESRYVYLGELSRAAANEELRRCNVLINASLQEGGPAIVTEAIVAGVPVLASDIPAHRALLGADYPALFRREDEQQLAELLRKATDDPSWLTLLKSWLKTRAAFFSPAHEAQQFIEFITTTISARKLTFAQGS
jgi:glycosyltransferase involved in cell wall biosynthesis